jgi:hypothetical protein
MEQSVVLAGVKMAKKSISLLPLMEQNKYLKLISSAQPKSNRFNKLPLVILT